MKEIAGLDPSFNEEKCCIYANGGSGLFLIDEKIADDFGKSIQKAFREVTGGGSSVTYVVQELPVDAPSDIDQLLKYPLDHTLSLVRYRLRARKDTSCPILALSSHPFLRQCSACGVEYASPEEPEQEGEERDSDEANDLYCISCQKKRRRDVTVKECIENIEAEKHIPYDDEYLWVRLIGGLRKGEHKYVLPLETERPHDFNVFRNFKGAKDYFGLIYADGNGMGKKIEECDTLAKLKDFAKEVDEAIYDAVCAAIKGHLKVGQHVKPKDELVNAPKHPLFPFDILLLGGDDVMMVVPASSAMDVALTITEKFYEFTNQKHTLSVGVVLAPIKYPFGLLQELVISTLKSAKTEGARKKKLQTEQDDERDVSLINFMTVTGSTSLDFKKVYASLFEKDVPVNVNGRRQRAAFYATLRPYDPVQLRILLNAIREGNRKGLGRTKLHQVREAVLKKNLTTSLSEARAVLRNWHEKQRNFVMEHFYQLADIYQQPYKDDNKPGTLFPRVTYPWFADGENTYRTSLLDFVELYDFVEKEEGSREHED